MKRIMTYELERPEAGLLDALHRNFVPKTELERAIREAADWQYRAACAEEKLEHYRRPRGLWLRILDVFTGGDQ